MLYIPIDLIKSLVLEIESKTKSSIWWGVEVEYDLMIDLGLIIYTLNTLKSNYLCLIDITNIQLCFIKDIGNSSSIYNIEFYKPHCIWFIYFTDGKNMIVKKEEDNYIINELY
jgi:hypothetical protein